MDRLWENKAHLIGNDEVVFRQLFVDYYPSLLVFAQKYVDDALIAEDLVQDVFVKVWETRERLKGVDDFSAYIYQMVRFKCFNHLRGEKVRGNATRQFSEDLNLTEIDTYIKEETFRLVVEALESLPPACRNIFTLALDGYKAKDIAEQLNLAVETVKKQKQIARRILREKLGNVFMFFCHV